MLSRSICTDKYFRRTLNAGTVTLQLHLWPEALIVATRVRNDAPWSAPERSVSAPQRPNTLPQPIIISYTYAAVERNESEGARLRCLCAIRAR